MVKKLLFSLSLLLILLVPQAKASHVLGGEMSYRCLGNGIYEFTVTLFRDCAGIGWDQPQVTVNGPSGAFILNRLPGIAGVADISQRCVTATFFGCGANPATGTGNPNGTVARFTYRGTTNLSALAAPPAAGYSFTMTNIPVNVRNNNNNTNLGVGGLQNSMGLRAIMYPFISPVTGVALTPAQLCDNSPEFVEDPAALQILNPLDTARFSNFAFDRDLDSMAYKVDVPLNGSLIPAAYSSPYTLLNPLPNSPPVVPAGVSALNPMSGVLTFRPNQAGNFLACVKVESWRCGQKVSEVFRDFQMQIINSPGGGAPPYIPGNLTTQRAPFITPYFLNASGQPIFDINFFVGDTIDVPIAASDYYPLFSPAMLPLPPPAGEFSMVIRGLQVSSTNNPNANCLLPPCATLRGISDPAPPAAVVTPPTNITGGNGQNLGLGYNAYFEGGGRLVWLPECANLSVSGASACGASSSSYQFAAIAVDKNCPIVGKEVQVYTFNIVDLPKLPAPRFRGVSAGVNNRSATIHFELDYDSLNIDPIDSFNFSNQTIAFQLQRSAERRRRSFRAYNIYRATSPAGPFTRIANPNQLYTNTFVDATVDLDVNDYYYYLTTVSSCDSSESRASDTLKVIRLNLNNNNVAGMAELRWDSTAVVHNRGYFPNASGTYVIEREVRTVNPGVWEVVDTVVNLYTYDQPVVVCSDTVFYRVALLDTNGTRYYSNIDGDLFEDIFSPDTILIHHVSVDSITGLPVLSWRPGPSPDVIAYVIYRLDYSSTPPTWRPIDTIPGYNSTYWFDTTSLQNPYDSSLHYGIAGMDSCGNTGLISRVHSTIHLTGGLDQCISSIVMDWTPYVGWNVSSYDIFRSASGGPYTLLATLPGGRPSYNYIDNDNLIQDSLYCYAILANRLGDDTTALSNTICVTARVIQDPEYSYIRKVTVDSATGNIVVVFVIDTAADAGRFELYRATAATDLREVISFTPADMTLNGGYLQYTYIDNQVFSNKEIYYYTVYVYDLCDQLYDTSNVSNNIYLQAVPEIDFTNRLRWNNYASWLGAVDRYEVLRFIPNYDPGFLPINTLGATSIVYNDDIKDFTDNDGLYSYLIQAVEGGSNPTGFRDTVLSNKVNVIQQPRMFMPTAFVPQGVNRILQPKGVFIEEIAGYNFEIYNRWGEQIFKTIDFTKGWNGTHSGTMELVDPGVYIYVVNFIGKNGKPYSQNGTFTVIR
ncbi:MAG: gliding motility-associated C-terminal domain-containing protein [Sphingobacteriaceae bacterium]|nr:gliding motility-associated C-terminal domain-containing protein [Sphingobacteriaceae bacterium]